MTTARTPRLPGYMSRQLGAIALGAAQAALLGGIAQTVTNGTTQGPAASVAISMSLGTVSGTFLVMASFGGVASVASTPGTFVLKRGTTSLPEAVGQTAFAGLFVSNADTAHTWNVAASLIDVVPAPAVTTYSATATTSSGTVTSAAGELMLTVVQVGGINGP